MLNIFNEIYKQLYIIYNSIKNEIILKSNIIYYLLFIIYYLLFIYKNYFDKKKKNTLSIKHITNLITYNQFNYYQYKNV